MSFEITTVEGKAFPSIKGTTVLDSALSAKLVFDYSCRNGQCGNCKTTLLDGKVKEIQPQLALHNKDEKNKFLSCCCEAVSNIKIDAADISALQKIQTKILPVRINSLVQMSDNIMQVELRLPPKSNFTFLEGQYIDILGPNFIRRSYSIASNSSSNEILLLIKRIKNGEFSNYWFNKAKINDLLRIEGPKGTFFIRNKEKPIVLLATGTGIAPIISMLDGLDSNQDYNENISLFWGNRFQKDFIWKPNYKNIFVDFNPVISRKDSNWKGEVGYVQNIALSKIKNIEKIDVYACGAIEMINSANTSFLEASLNERDFYSDAFVQSFNNHKE
jgi:CDP-4-dehydro-6-deoxyglucose reductase, E3